MNNYTYSQNSTDTHTKKNEEKKKKSTPTRTPTYTAVKEDSSTPPEQHLRTQKRIKKQTKKENKKKTPDQPRIVTDDTTISPNDLQDITSSSYKLLIIF